MRPSALAAMSSRAVIRRRSAAAAGVVSAGFALGLGELAAGSAGEQPSLVSAIGTEFINRFAASLKELAVEWFGTHDKPALVVGIVVSSLLLGAVFGLIASRWFWLGAAGFAAFGLLGAWAYGRDPLGSTTTGLVIALAATVGGIGALWFLLRLATGPMTPPMATGDGVAVEGDIVPAPLADLADPRHTPRRAFIAGAALLGAGAASTAFVGRRLRSNGGIETVRQRVALPPPAAPSEVPPDAFDVTGLSPYITPTGDFYRIDTALTIPRIDPSSWELDITGLLDRPYRLTYDELLRMDAVEETVTLQCVSNEVGGDLVGNAVWQGVTLTDLLQRARPRAEATQLVGRSVDRFTVGFPSELIDGERVALVAYAMNGEPLPARHGFPARLVVAGLYGYVSATKWLREIELTTWDDFDGYWISRGWAKEGPTKTASRIDVPSSGTTITAGPTPIAGVAWAPTRGISMVEVRVDDGDWVPCRLGDAASENTWVQWLHEWDATTGDHVITVRATDGAGQTQTSDVASPAPDGATGWHSRRIRVVT
jgi:DMSO/TMAO reductase YedYZ molybdopterin-dependent catalytic subunit